MVKLNKKTEGFPQANNRHFIRQRINSLLSRAAEKSLVVVCAGMGYGKTRAVSEFARESKTPTAWIQLSEFDNNGAMFWKNYVSAIAIIDELYAEELIKIGFPDNEDKQRRFKNARYSEKLKNSKHLIVLDDFHIIKDHAVICFIERAIYNLPSNFSFIIICRTFPQLNILSLEIKNMVHQIQEDDLNFTETELVQYLKAQRLPIETQYLHEIYQDTKGWAFSVSLIARSLRKSPLYWGYVRSAMKSSIFKLIETEVWDTASEHLKRFWVRISLIEHFSADLMSLLCNDNNIITEFRQQSAYVRFDSYANTFLIHHLFIDYLRAKQDILDDDEVRVTYKTTGDWCKQNGFTIDAMNYYEKIGDYESIVSIFDELSAFVPNDIALKALEIFERAPEETCDLVKFFATKHLRIVMCLGRFEEALELAERYEKRFIQLPEDNVFRNHALSGVYYCWGCIRANMSTIDDCYDFDAYFAKMNECLRKSPLKPNQFINIPIGPWVSLVGAAKQGAPQKYVESLTRAVKHASSCLGTGMTGEDDLCYGELKFYQGDLATAEAYFDKAVEHSQKQGQCEVVHRALFYIERIAFSQGNREKVENALMDMKTRLNKKEYPLRFISYDIAISWYYYYLRQPEMVRGWLKDKFTPYIRASFIENFENQMKARYHYLVKNYSPLLDYVEDMKRRESILYGRVEMLTLEACALYQLKDRKGAFATLREAYETASPNNILMPFIELGKDMRSLITVALRDEVCRIPQAWLKNLNHKSHFYARNQAQFISDYVKHNGANEDKVFSSMETEFLNDLYNGLSKNEIAAKHGLSINTVKMVTKSIYEKLNAHSIADVIRFVAERNLAQASDDLLAFAK